MVFQHHKKKSCDTLCCVGSFFVIKNNSSSSNIVTERRDEKWKCDNSRTTNIKKTTESSEMFLHILCYCSLFLAPQSFFLRFRSLIKAIDRQAHTGTEINIANRLCRCKKQNFIYKKRILFHFCICFVCTFCLICLNS